MRFDCYSTHTCRPRSGRAHRGHINQGGDIEVKVRMLNINVGRNKALFDACKPLQEYSWIVDKVRTYSKQMPIETAIDKVLAEMSDGFQLKPLLLKHKAEVKGMILTEYNEEEVMNGFKEEAYMDGVVKTLIDLVKEQLLSISDAAKKLNVSEIEFKRLMEQQ